MITSLQQWHSFRQELIRFQPWHTPDVSAHLFCMDDLNSEVLDTLLLCPSKRVSTFSILLCLFLGRLHTTHQESIITLNGLEQHGNPIQSMHRVSVLPSVAPSVIESTAVCELGLNARHEGGSDSLLAHYKKAQYVPKGWLLHLFCTSPLPHLFVFFSRLPFT